MSRILVVGFDGATLDLCERWIAEDRMPVLGSIMAAGSFGPMRSTFPYNSAVAWASLATGASAGRHGIYDFVIPREGEYQLRVATREDRRVPALWNYASDAGARVGVVNVPMTFPAEAVNGVMVSGMDAPRLDERAVHPRGHLAQLRQWSPRYVIVSKAALAAQKGDWAAAERELIKTIVARARYTCELARQPDLDLLMVNLEATDGAHHFFWQHFDPAHPRHDPTSATAWGDAIGRVYEASDYELGRIIDAYSPDTVFVVSDHGGGPSKDLALYMNDWLAAEGFLTIRPRAGSSVAKKAYAAAMKRMSVPLKRRLRPLFGRAIERAKGLALYGDVAWESTRAYGTVQPMVRLNLAGRERQGSLSIDEADGVLSELAERAAGRRLPSGEPLFTAIHRASDVYAGDAPGGPDLVVEPQQGIDVRGRNTSGLPGFLVSLKEMGLYYPSGVHTPVGMVAASGTAVDNLGRVAETDIHQVAPSVLAAMGVPAPTLDGQPFGFVSASYVSTGRGPETVQAEGTDLEAEEEDQILERLRGLGYVD